MTKNDTEEQLGGFEPKREENFVRMAVSTGSPDFLGPDSGNRRYAAIYPDVTVRVSGPQGSGKTTVAEAVRRLGLGVKVVEG